MLDPKATWVEVHPLTADHDGVYRCDDEPWGDDLFVVQDSEWYETDPKLGPRRLA